MFFDGGYPNMTEEYETYKTLDKIFQETYYGCIDSRNKMSYFKNRLLDLKVEMSNWHEDMNLDDDNFASMSTPHLQDHNRVMNTVVLDPTVVQGRGRPRTTRYRSRREIQHSNSQQARHNRGGRGRGRGRRRGQCTNNTNEVLASQVMHENTYEEHALVNNDIHTSQLESTPPNNMSQQFSDTDMRNWIGLHF